MDLSVDAGLMGGVIASNDPYYMASQNHLSGQQDSKAMSALDFSVSMIQIENTIARCMNTWQTSGPNRFGGVAESKYAKLEGNEQRVRELDYGWSSNPRDLVLTPNPLDYHQKPSDVPKNE